MLDENTQTFILSVNIAGNYGRKSSSLRDIERSMWVSKKVHL